LLGNEKCYISLVENLNLGDTYCLKLAISKGLGLGIVVGGSIMKVPQLLLIYRSSSARGLSFPAFLLETLSYAITTAYSVRAEFPFSTYGENLFLAIQNTLICLAILYYSRTSSNTAIGLVGLAMLASYAALFQISGELLAYCQLSTLPLSLLSKLPQIAQNARAKSTGQLSAFAVLSQVLGCLARLFTSKTELGKGGDIVVMGFALALVLNLVLGAQMIMYWQSGDHATLAKKSEAILVNEKGGDASAWPAPSLKERERLAGFAPNNTGRKWSRKLE